MLIVQYGIFLSYKLKQEEQKIKTKNILIFTAGFISCLIMTIFLSYLLGYDYLKLEGSDKTLEVILTVDKSFDMSEHDPIDVFDFLNTDYHEFDVEVDTKNIKNKDSMDDNAPNIDYQVLVNEKKLNLHATQINNETYINLKELQQSLNHLNVNVFNNDKVLSIYESSGLGIIECNGEEYIEYRDIMERYSMGKSEI